MPDNISPLVAADEKLNHQTVDSFSAVATSDLAWTEKVWSSWFSIQSTISARVLLPVLPSTDWPTTGGRFRSRCACEA